jgi:hypothetical protein
MLTKEELLILGVAATDDLGEYFVSREYNKPWGEQYAAMKNLEELGLMNIKSAGRQRWLRLSEQIFRVDKWSVCRG